MWELVYNTPTDRMERYAVGTNWIYRNWVRVHPNDPWTITLCWAAGA